MDRRLIDSLKRTLIKTLKTLFLINLNFVVFTALKLKHFEDVMKEVGLFFFKVDELEYTYPDDSMPCEKEFYWAVFKDETTW